jgi:hypothetical protein
MMIPASATLSSRQSARGVDPHGAGIGRQKRDGGRSDEFIALPVSRFAKSIQADSSTV